MKKRIIALGLAITVLFCSLGFAKRASAAATGTIVAIASIGSLAFSVLMLITSGEAERIADGVYNWIEYTAKPGAEELFVGDGSDLAIGYNQIFQTMKGWFDSGELEIVDGKVKLTYQQYQALYGQVVSVMAKPVVDFQAGFNCTFLAIDLSSAFSLSSLPIITEFVYTGSGEAYTPIYYDDNHIIFSSYYLYLYSDSGGHATSLFPRYIRSSSFDIKDMSGGINDGSSLSAFYDNYRYILSMPNLNTFDLSYYLMGCDWTFNNSVDYCFVYENGSLTYEPISNVDVSGMSSGLVTTTGDYGAFLKSLRGFSPSVVPPDNLDDLSGTIPTEYNPSLTFPVNPDSSSPLANQVIVGDVPGVSNLPLSEQQFRSRSYASSQGIL